MRHRFLGSIAALTAGAGIAAGQGPARSVLPEPSSPAPPSRLSATTLPSAPMGEPLPPSGPIMPAQYMPGAVPPGGMPGPMGPMGPAGPMGSFEPAVPMGGASCPTERMFAQLDYLLWRVQDGPSTFPLLVSGTNPAGALGGAPGAVILFGGNGFEWDYFSGGRATVGFWIRGCPRIGVVGSGFVLEKETVGGFTQTGPAGIPILGRPFVNELTGLVEPLNLTTPQGSGNVSGSAGSQLWSADLSLMANLYRSSSAFWNVSAGYRHVNLTEDILVNTTSNIINPGMFFLGRPLPRPAQVTTEDQWRMSNRYHLANFGTEWEFRWGCWRLNCNTQVGLGSVHQTNESSGFTRVNSGGATQQVPGGVLTQLTNIGTRTQNVFAVVPEWRVQLGYQVTRHTEFVCGYNLIWMNDVLRPGQQIDNTVNPTIMPLHPLYGQPFGTARPAPMTNSTSFWAQGVNFGIRVHY